MSITEIRIHFFDGINEVTRVCSIRGKKSYRYYFIYDVYSDVTSNIIYVGQQRLIALKFMRETGNMPESDEQIIMGMDV